MSLPRELTAAEVRVLGCLIEKEKTVPDSYPLTLKALRAACCQKSNREPVVDIPESDVLRAVDNLRVLKLSTLISTAGSRVPKYGHDAETILHLHEAELALLTELILRGPQTVGELRNRASRMVDLPSIGATEKALDRLMEPRPKPYVMRLPVAPGQKEPRYAHLLAGEPEIPAPTAARQESARAILHQEDQQVEELAETVAQLREELNALRQEFTEFRQQFE